MMSSSDRAHDSSLQFKISALGRTCLERRSSDGRWEVLLRSGKALALLVFLAAKEGAEVPRDALGDLLWGDSNPVKSRTSLRQALHQLRGLVGDELLRTDRHSVSLSLDDVSLDWIAFLSLRRAGQFERAAELYAGSFCATLASIEESGFNEWSAAERLRLERAFHDASSKAIAQRMQQSQYEPAIVLARHWHSLLPDNELGLVALCDSLLAGGKPLEAQEVLEAHLALRDVAGEAVSTAVSERLSRIRSRRPEVVNLGTVDSLGRSLIGRDGELHELLRACEAARGGHARRLLVLGPAGMGKTKLIDELEARIRVRGARVVKIRVAPGMRQVKWSLLSDLVRQITALPGALGVSERTASVLIGLDTSQSRHFPAARPVTPGTDGWELLCRDALADLMEAVAENRLLVLIVDDLHHADEDSQRILASYSRRPDLRLAEVWGARPGHIEGFAGADTSVVLSAFDVSDIRAVMEEALVLPDAEWVAPVLEAIQDRSRGVPNAVLQLLRHTLATGALHEQSGRWHASDTAGVTADIAHDPVTEPLVGITETLDRALLRLLAVWGLACEEHDLFGLIALIPDLSETADTTVLQSLRRLESLGLVQTRDDTWQVAHETVTEASLIACSEREASAILTAVITYWCSRERLTVAVMEVLARTCGTMNAPDHAIDAVNRVARSAAMRRSGLVGSRLSRTFARAAGKPEWQDLLTRSLHFSARLGPAARAAIGFSAGAACAFALWLAAMLQPRLRVEVAPLADAYPAPKVVLAVQPRIVVEDGFGRTVNRPLTVRARTSSGSLIGDTAVVVKNGRLQFQNLALEVGASGGLTETPLFTFTGPWWVRSTSASVNGIFVGPDGRTFAVVSLRVNGLDVTDSLAYDARVGEALEISLTFEYTTRIASANYLIGASPTWGKIDQSVTRLAGLPSPVEAAWRTVSFTVPDSPTPTIGYVVILMGPEDRVDFMFSSTNWSYGQPIWGDGNDIVTQSASKLEELRQYGSIEIAGYLDGVNPIRKSTIQLDVPPFPDTSIAARGAIQRKSWHGTALRVRVRETE